MFRGKGGDSTEALRRVWMEGYEAGKRAASTPPVVVEIDPADIQAAYSHPCANPASCPACRSRDQRGPGPDPPTPEIVAALLPEGVEWMEDVAGAPRPYWRNTRALDAEAEAERLCAVVHHMTLMLNAFGMHEIGCCCAAGSEPTHAENCKDCDCGLTAAIAFGVEQSDRPLEPPDATPEEEARLHEIGVQIVDGLLARMRAERQG